MKFTTSTCGREQVKSGILQVKGGMRSRLSLALEILSSTDYTPPLIQRPKKSKFSGWQTFTRKNFPDGVRKSFFQQMRQKVRKSFSRHIHQYVSRPSRKFPDHLESFQTIWKIFRPSGKFPDHLESFQAIWKVSRPPGKFPGHLESFQTIWKVPRPSENFSDHLESF